MHCLIFSEPWEQPSEKQHRNWNYSVWCSLSAFWNGIRLSAYFVSNRTMQEGLESSNHFTPPQHKGLEWKDGLCLKKKKNTYTLSFFNKMLHEMHFSAVVGGKAAINHRAQNITLVTWKTSSNYLAASGNLSLKLNSVINHRTAQTSFVISRWW